jgi:SAM-dependent methyltransferase
LFLSEDLVIDGLKKVAEETAAKANEQVNNNKHHYTYPLKGYFFDGDHDKDLFEGTGKFATLIYTANLISSWIPALDNGKVEQKLKQERGLKVADIGCGYGTSTILMAKAYPNSKFYGFDNHSASIEHARNKAREEGLGEERIEFEIASSTNFPFPTEGTYGSSNNEDKQKK